MLLFSLLGSLAEDRVCREWGRGIKGWGGLRYIQGLKRQKQLSLDVLQRRKRCGCGVCVRVRKEATKAPSPRHVPRMGFPSVVSL